MTPAAVKARAPGAWATHALRAEGHDVHAIAARLKVHVETVRTQLRRVARLLADDGTPKTDRFTDKALSEPRRCGVCRLLRPCGDCLRPSWMVGSARPGDGAPLA